MPQYVYKCPEGHSKEVLHSMTYAEPTICDDCGQEMHRVPQVVGVVWNGIPPHKEHRRGKVATDYLKDYDANREKYIAKQEKRGKYINE